MNGPDYEATRNSETERTKVNVNNVNRQQGEKGQMKGRITSGKQMERRRKQK